MTAVDSIPSMGGGFRTGDISWSAGLPVPCACSCRSGPTVFVSCIGLLYYLLSLVLALVVVVVMAYSVLSVLVIVSSFFLLGNVSFIIDGRICLCLRMGRHTCWCMGAGRVQAPTECQALEDHLLVYGGGRWREMEADSRRLTRPAWTTTLTRGTYGHGSWWCKRALVAHLRAYLPSPRPRAALP